MDTNMPKLPAYVFRRANGSYRYKRNVPKRLVGLIGKATLYRQLGENYAEAMQNLPKVHSEIEKLFRDEAHVPSSERSLAIIRGALGSDVAEQVLAGQVVEYSQEDYALNELARDIAGKLSDDIVTQIYTGRLKQPALTLQKALGEYQQYKTEDAGESRELELRVARALKDLGTAIGKQRVAQTPLGEITRADANALRDHLLERMKASSVHRYITVVRAAVNYVIAEHSLNIPNVFNGLRIKGASASIDDRLPMSDQDLAVAAPNFEDDPVAKALFVTLTDTGARLSEITGLEVQDVDLQQRSITIRPNGIRQLKTKGSQRTLPLSQRALELLQGHRRGKGDSAPIFAEYSRPRGRDAASAMMMKRLRRSITDKKLTMHSLRHRMKDKLRNTGCPEVISLAILGHSTNTVAANYGSGYALEVMREHLKKTWT
ncbi:tyrosine-type recombinase/integrase [Nereida ignava]|uniref:tyrosine-type recombinase/integrase n=1 Tax=Nereida ignava TaxID=282199 RepID=UPI002FE2F203